MKADLSRDTFRPERHYSSVRIQQGVVQLDADANEQTDIALYRDETTTEDVVGPHGAPLHDAGFELTVGADGDIEIGAGRMYVHGTLCENEAPVRFQAQPDLPGGHPMFLGDGRRLFYLDVWQQHVTALDEPDIHEVALGDAFTATRTRTVWQVKALMVHTDHECGDFGPDWAAVPPGTGTLRAQESPSQDAADDCQVPPGAGYRRLENQLYRVEIHDGTGTEGGPTYKWSRDNGSVAGVVEAIDGTRLRVSEPSREAERAVAGARWIELSDDTRALWSRPGTFVEVVRDGDAFEIVSPNPPTLADFDGAPIARRWDSDKLSVLTGSPVELEDGVEVEFAAGTYFSGDYWLIPARSLTGQVLWPRVAGVPRFEPPHGVEHRYAPLALFDLADGTWTRHSDCRRLFPPLTQLTDFFYLGGDGQEAMPDGANPAARVPLALPLQVGVSNGRWPVTGARVTFAVTGGTGRLNGAAAAANVTTGPDGVASCTWEVDPVTPSQTVLATLVDDHGTAMHLPIRFGAKLSVASRVAYTPVCDPLAGAFTVQAAIDRAALIPRMHYAGGDGQQALPGAELDPLMVVVSSDCGPRKGAVVHFEVVRGDGLVDAASSADVTTGSDGLAQCLWKLGPTEHRQEVTARLVEPDRAEVVTFRARTSVATEVAFDPSNCDAVSGAGTVQDAIDALCHVQGPPKDDVVKILEVALAARRLLNDSDRLADELRQGIQILCDQPLDQASVQGKPVCSVTLDMPWPVLTTTQWGDDFAGFQPIVLDAVVHASHDRIIWIPTEAAANWLNGQFRVMMIEMGFPPILAHLRVKGNFVWSGKVRDQRFLDGEAFGRRRGRGNSAATDVGLPSGDDRRGGDFEMWFRAGVEQ